MNIASNASSSSADSALQLYSTAYECQYEHNDSKEACRIYREIIRKFPDSNESAYAVVQLEKIGAQEALKSLQGSAWQKIISIAALLFSLFALIIAGTALLLVLEKNRNSMYNSIDIYFACEGNINHHQTTLCDRVLPNTPYISI